MIFVASFTPREILLDNELVPKQACTTLNTSVINISLLHSWISSLPSTWNRNLGWRLGVGKRATLGPDKPQKERNSLGWYAVLLVNWHLTKGRQCLDFGDGLDGSVLWSACVVFKPALGYTGWEWKQIRPMKVSLSDSQASLTWPMRVGPGWASPRWRPCSAVMSGHPSGCVSGWGCSLSHWN